MSAASEAALGGERVVVVDDQTRALLPPGANFTLLDRSYCFGLYEGNLLGVLQQEPHAQARERLVHIRAKHIVVATGAYEAPLTFKNNDLPGIMLSSAVGRLIRRHGIQPGNSAVIVSIDAADSDIAAELRNAGVSVVATVPPSEVLEAAGGKHVTGLRTKRGNFICDLVVMCGHRIPDTGLLSQAGAKLEWSARAGAFVPVEFPPNVTAVGDVLGTDLKAAAILPAPPDTTNKRTFVCLCNDVTTQDLCDGVAEGFDHIELLKRYTTTTMGPCQGRMCQLQAIGICARETGRAIPGNRRDHGTSAESRRYSRGTWRSAPSSDPPHAACITSMKSWEQFGWTWAIGNALGSMRTPQPAPSAIAFSRNIRRCGKRSG